MKKNLAILLAALSVAAVGFLLFSGGPEGLSRQVAPQAGRECFEFHRPRMPPGSQYEGFEVEGDDLLVKVMTGIDMREFRCSLTTDGGIDPERTGLLE